MESENSIEIDKSRQRMILSVVIASVSLVGLGLVSCYVLISPSSVDPISHETVFTTIVSLVGTWIGTLLAFYFSRDSYESASRNTRELVKQVTTTQQKLRSLKAEDKMYHLHQISYLKVKVGEEGKYHLEDLLKDEKYLKKHNRLPIFTEDLLPKFMVHKSLITDYILEKQLQTLSSGTGTTAPNTKENRLSLYDLVTDARFGEQAKNSYAVIKPHDSFETAKLLMDKKSTDTVICSDVFITKNGSVNSPVIGWITNVLINENSTVE